MGEPTDESTKGDKRRRVDSTNAARGGSDRAPDDLVETVGEAIDSVKEKLQGR